MSHINSLEILLFLFEFRALFTFWLHSIECLASESLTEALVFTSRVPFYQ